MEKPQKNHPFFAILLSKVRGSVRFLGGSVGSRFGSQEQTGGSVGSRFGFWRFGRFEVRYFQVRPNTSARTCIWDIRGYDKISSHSCMFCVSFKSQNIVRIWKYFSSSEENSEDIIIFFNCSISN